jgi:hypothetical protein
MKVIQIVGLLLLLFGGYVLVRGLTVTRDREVLDVGGVSASVEERQRIPTWVGAVSAGVGLALIVAGARGGRHVT